eukprot:CAMPEP_0183486574 /NCGR_PEP_ID=MMETSP0370-20130417/180005_1 /TAXON_ID=268820 /ORGANISM="Peridinium aciculiferum, Strain PAER-2" /LENGTH=583 /DNA_ID=CAMNT_0025679893 /DNA_START=35 /DNA_END=1784 /DNA_ORIENTATION=-
MYWNASSSSAAAGRSDFARFIGIERCQDDPHAREGGETLCNPKSGCSTAERFLAPVGAGCVVRPDGPEYSKVAERQGDYEMVANYNFVGEGTGSFEKETITSYYGWRLGRKCIFCMIVTVLCGVLVAIWSTIPASGTATSTMKSGLRPLPSTSIAQISPMSPSTSAPFDCENGLADWQNGWALQKKIWCCQNTIAHHGCSESTFDCSAGVQWLDLWADDKRLYCCVDQGTGCPANAGATTTAPAPLFDCKDGWPNGSSDWPTSKTAWCCTNVGRGCETTTSAPFDCQAGYGRWQTGWSAEKQQWCCSREAKGCTTTSTSTSLPFECQAASGNVAAAWPDAKKQWCCQRQGLGCTTTTPCPTTTTPPFDCEAALNNWEAVWSGEKKTWCCWHHAKGCTTTQPPTTTTQAPTTTQPPTTTTQAPTTTISLPFDCEVGLNNFQFGWLSSKKVWCCSNERRGCATPAPVMESFECEVAYDNWQAGWSEEKKSGAAKITKKGAWKLWKHSTVTKATRLLQRDGLSRSRLGAAKAWAVLVSTPCSLPTIARRTSTIGPTGGRWIRRRGVARQAAVGARFLDHRHPSLLG